MQAASAGTAGAKGGRPDLVTMALWLMVAVLDGIDLQTVGVAAPGIAAEFGLDPAQRGWLLSLGTVGIAVGAASGGWAADRFGRKAVLVWSVALFGIFSIGTALSWDLTTLLATRFLTGLGLGAAMPNLVALVAESSAAKSRNMSIGIIYCGMPIGAALAALFAYLFIADHGWRIVFYIGGIGPLLIAPLLGLFLRESREYGAARAAAPVASSSVSALFTGGRGRVTAALWIASFSTLAVHYLLLNWLVSFLVAKGFTPAQASGIQIAYNLGGIPGMLLSGAMLDTKRRRIGVIVMYAALIAVLASLGPVDAAIPIVVLVFTACLCTAAALIVLYALPSEHYDTVARGTGIGATVATGRAGGIISPIVAGQLLNAGFSTGTVLLLGVPGVALAAVALLWILSRRPVAN